MIKKELSLKLCFFLIFQFIMINVIFSQEKIIDIKEEKELEIQNAIKEIAKVDYGNGWLDYKKGISFNESTFFIENQKAFGLGDHDLMVLDKVKYDELGFEHYFYIQTYRDIPLEGVKYILHVKDREIVSSNGKIVVGLDDNNNVFISEEEAYGSITKISGINTNIKGVYDIDREKGTLIYTLKESASKLNKNDLVLCYRYNQILNGVTSNIYINANNAEVEKVVSRVKHESTQEGTASTLYNGSQTVETTRTWNFGYNYWSRENEDRNIKVASGNLWSYTYGCDCSDSGNNNIWSGTADRPFISALWAAENAWDYFELRFGHNGINDNGRELRVMIDYAGTEISDDQAAYLYTNSTDYILVGETNQANHLVSLEVVTHEYTHGVLENIVGFSGSGEPSCIEESLCDIFGVIVNYVYHPSSYDFVIGEWEWNITGTEDIRNLKYPHNSGVTGPQPEYYMEPGYWQSNWAAGYDARHINTGPMNKWFTLLAEGGTFRGIDVEDIGPLKVDNILWIALNNYLDPYSDYADVKNATIKAAMYWYGNCSAEAQAVYDAWEAVNVTANSPTLDKVVNCTDVTNTHNLNQTYSFHTVGNAEMNCSLANGKSTVIRASDCVTLKQGFSSGGGSSTDFHAYIQTCESPSKSMNRSINTFKENGGEIEQTVKIGEKETPLKLVVYPNPNNGFFNIQTNRAAETLSVCVVNVLGSVVYTDVITEESSSQINISDYPSGIYLVKVDVGEQTFTERIVKH